MLRKVGILALCWLFSGGLLAQTIEVKMLHRGPIGPMAYEPSFVKIAPGDTVKFIKSAPGHNAASIPTMWPKGAMTYRGNINQEIEMTFDTPGFYGIECTPHFAMGMVMLIQVGEPDKHTLVFPESLPRRAKARFDKIVEQFLP